MRVFHCDHCGNLVFFENVQCVHCKHVLAYAPDLNVVTSLDAAGDSGWTSPLERAEGRLYKLCQNYTNHNVCNWALPADDAHQMCKSCRLTRTIPALGKEVNKHYWYRLEVAKRRLVYTLVELKLPVKNKVDDPERGLVFDFLEDSDAPGATKVLTGHDGGVITLNLSEADDAEREKRRWQFHEPYRTLLGHFRHEVGHYYWDRLIRDAPRLMDFRDLFGDERADYGLALQKHYGQGPPPDWQDRYISTYATSHAWEDWAETWAHYLHMTDTLETAAACGLSSQPRRDDEPALPAVINPVGRGDVSFDDMMKSWDPLTYMLNNLNRGLGIGDAYPFVLSKPAVDKLRFVHETVLRCNA